jgi:ABC-type multidrug transport system fused ATPase/permease subunit
VRNCVSLYHFSSKIRTFNDDISTAVICTCIFVYLHMKNLILLLLTISIYSTVIAQSQNERKVATTQKELFNKVAQLDSSLFAAYNSKKLDLMKTYFTNDLEWYQDNGGLIGFEKVFENFNSIFNRDYDLKRNLIKESLEVHPIEGYGAIEIGKHQFKHIENGKLEIGTFKFLMIWKNDNGNWKISRVISYDH